MSVLHNFENAQDNIIYI